MIKTAVIGFGLSARVFHLPFITRSAEFQLVGISTSQAVAAKYWPDVPLYTDAEALIQQTDASLIVITAPNCAHFSLAKAALLAGKDVLVEKPLAVTVSEATALQALAQRLQRKLAVFHNRRFDDDFLAIQQLVRSGQLGTVQLMYSRFDRFRPTIQARWKESAEPGNGILYDLAPHLLDQSLALFGRPDSITASCLNLRATDGTKSGIDYFQLRLDYPARQVVLSSSPYCAHPAPRFELHGSSGSFVSVGLDPQEQLLREALQTTAMSPLAVFHSSGWLQREKDRSGQVFRSQGAQHIQLPLSDYASFYQQLALFLRAEGPAPVPLDDAIMGIKLIELALQSSLEQRSLPVPTKL